MLLLLVAVACERPEPAPEFPADDPIPVPAAPDLRPSDGLLERPELQEIVDLQVARDGAALRERLGSADAAVRARAAYALASVQSPDALPELEALLADPDPAVRADAAFALGQIELPDGGERLAGALGDETDPAVRTRLVEAIGKRGGEASVSALLQGGEEGGSIPELDAPDGTLALARAGLRDVRPQGLVGALIDRLTHDDADVRAMAAYYFGRSPDTGAWRPAAARVRAALDGYARDEPAAMHLVPAIARLSDLNEDAERLLGWLDEAEDWRIRAEVVGMFASPAWLPADGVIDALFEALSDPSPHVRHAAAGGVALALWNDEDLPVRPRDLIEGPVEEWRVQARMLAPLAASGEGERVFDWARRMADHHPVAGVRGVEALGGLSGTPITELLFELSEHPEPLVRAAALRSLGQRWARQDGDEAFVRRHFERFRDRLLDEHPLPAARAARALGHAGFQPLGSADALEAGWAYHTPEPAQGDPNVLVPILEAMGPGSLDLLREVAAAGDDVDPRVRAAAARGVLRVTGSAPPGVDPDTLDEVGAPVRTIDWDALAALGPEPRVRIETERGDLVIRLAPEDAPLTVYSFAEEVRRGSYDAVRFHRIVPNFVIQGGDTSLGEGTGDPDFRIRTEITRIPFRRGAAGMASAGKDTEGTQFYLMHSAQPHLESGYTAFGWLESGAEALDRIREGDPILGAELLGPDGGS